MKYKTIGQIIRDKRNQIQCSQEAIASALGVSIKFISLVENGERSLSVNHFPTLSEFLEIPIKELYNSKLFEERAQIELKRIKKELRKCDKINKKVDMSLVKELRSKEINEQIRFLEIQRQDYIKSIKMLQINKNQIETHIAVLNEEKKLLGFGQLQLKL